MKLPRRDFLHLAASAAALPTFSRIARAQTYPSRPVRLIVPVAPAGATDITARLIGQWLSERLGQQFVIENRPGAGGNIGVEAVVRAPTCHMHPRPIAEAAAQPNARPPASDGARPNQFTTRVCRSSRLEHRDMLVVRHGSTPRSVEKNDALSMVASAPITARAAPSSGHRREHSLWASATRPTQ